MAKKNREVVESTENILTGDVAPATESTEQVVDAPAAEVVPEVPVIPDTPEVAAARKIYAELAVEVNTISEALKAKRKDQKKAKEVLDALIKGETPKSAKTYKFIPFGGNVDDIKLSNGKPLSYQGKLLVTIFNKPIAEETAMSKEEILAKLNEVGYPCVGDMWDNFSWYKTQILTPLGLIAK